MGLSETHGTVRDTKEPEEHILVSTGCHLRHHGLSISIIRRLEQSKQNIVNPEISHMMITNRLRPQAQHAVERDQDAEEIGHHEHMLRLDPEIFLDVPEPESRCDGTSGLRNSQVCDFKEGELHNLVLDDPDQGSGCVETIS